MSWQEAQSLDESLLSLDAFLDAPPRIVEILSGGLTNRCWKIIDSSGNAYVWRPKSSVSYHFGLSRSKEYQLLQSIHSYGFTPRPVILIHLFVFQVLEKQRSRLRRKHNEESIRGLGNTYGQ